MYMIYIPKCKYFISHDNLHPAPLSWYKWRKLNNDLIWPCEPVLQTIVSPGFCDQMERPGHLDLSFLYTPTHPGMTHAGGKQRREEEDQNKLSPPSSVLKNLLTQVTKMTKAFCVVKHEDSWIWAPGDGCRNQH